MNRTIGIIILIVALISSAFLFFYRNEGNEENNPGISEELLSSYQNKDWGYEVEYDSNKIVLFYDDNSVDHGYAQFHYLGEAPSLNIPIIILSDRTEYGTIEEYFQKELVGIEDAYHNSAQLIVLQDKKFNGLSYGYLSEVWSPDAIYEYYLILKDNIVHTIIVQNIKYIEDNNINKDDLDNFLNSIIFK